MKKTAILGIFMIVMGVHNALAQDKVKDKNEQNKEQNLVDLQFDVMQDVLGGTDSSENPLDGFNNYEEMLQASELSPDLKENLMQQYKLIELNTDPAQRDSLRLVFAQNLKKAMAQAKNPKN